MKPYLILGVLSVSLTACIGTAPTYQPPATHIMQTTFDAEAASKILEKGSGSISGQSFLRQIGGDVVTCAGEDVSLIPTTEYAKEYIKVKHGDRVYVSVSPQYHYPPRPKITDLDMNFDRYQRATVCDANGRFEFNNVPVGTYYLRTLVDWKVRYSQGGYMINMILVEDNETKEVIVTR